MSLVDFGMLERCQDMENISLILEFVTFCVFFSFSDMRRHGKLNLECKPEWWPEEIDFRSASLRNPAMKMEEVDLVLNNCVNFVQALYAGEDSSDNGSGDDANEQIPDVDVVNNCGVNNYGVNKDVDNGDGKGVVADVNVSGDAVSDRGCCYGETHCPTTK